MCRCNTGTEMPQPSQRPVRNASYGFGTDERAKLAALDGDAAGCERRLREAQRLFSEIGAPRRADQVRAELEG